MSSDTLTVDADTRVQKEESHPPHHLAELQPPLFERVSVTTVGAALAGSPLPSPSPSPPLSPEGSLNGGEAFSEFVSASVSPPPQVRSAIAAPPGTEIAVAPSSLHPSSATPAVAALQLQGVETGANTAAAPMPNASPLLFTPAVDSESRSESALFSPLQPSVMPASALASAPFTPFTPFTPAPDATSMPPATTQGSGASSVHFSPPRLPPQHGGAAGGSGFMTAGQQTTAAAATPSRASAATTLVDHPLSYAATYSPNASTRRIVERITEKQARKADLSSREGGGGGMDVGASASSSAAAAAAISAASPAPSAATPQARSGFLSSLFGWGSGSSTSAKPSSISLPGTPNNDPDSAPLHYPHTTTNASISSGGRMSLSVSQPMSLAKIRVSGDRRGSGVGAAGSTGPVHAVRTPVAGSHPLLVHPLVPLSSKEQSALLSYSQRLKSSLASHEAKISRLQSLKKKYQLTRNEETAIWNKFAISSLVSIAASLYHTHLLHCSALLQMEFSFTAELSQHLNQVQLVLDEKMPLATLLDDIENRVESFLDEQDAREEAAAAAATTGSAATLAASASTSTTHAPSPAAIRTIRERRRSSANAPTPGSINSSPSLSNSALKSRFLTSAEIESMFWPPASGGDGHAPMQGMEEQVRALGETAAKLERTYKEMQKKALSQTDSKQSRTFKLHSLLSKHGLESDGRDQQLWSELFYLHRNHAGTRHAQVNFNTLLLDQRCEEGKIISRWIDRMHALHAVQLANPHASAAAVVAAVGGTAVSGGIAGGGGPATGEGGRVTPELILNFIEFMRAEVCKKYDLASMEKEREEQKKQAEAAAVVAAASSGDAHDGSGVGIGGSGTDAPANYTLSDPLVLFLSRMLYPKLSVLLRSLRSDQESDLDLWFLKKLSWISLLTRAQIGINKIFLPPGCNMDAKHAFQWPERAGDEGHEEVPLDESEDEQDEDGAGAAGEEEEEIEAQNMEQFLSSSDASAPARRSRGRSGSALSASALALPYQSAMSLLHRLNSGADCLAPIDLLFLIIRTIREITRLANAYQEMHREAERKTKQQQQQLQQQSPLLAAALAADGAAAAASPSDSASPVSTTSSTSVVTGSSPAGSAASSVVSPPASSFQPLNADNMFPLVLYVVIHSGLRCPHFVFGTLSRFLPDSTLHFGTAGYSLILIESAVSHLCDMARSDIQAGPAALVSPKKKKNHHALVNEGSSNSSSTTSSSGIGGGLQLPPPPAADSSFYSSTPPRKPAQAPASATSATSEALPSLSDGSPVMPPLPATPSQSSSA